MRVEAAQAAGELHELRQHGVVVAEIGLDLEVLNEAVEQHRVRNDHAIAQPGHVRRIKQVGREVQDDADGGEEVNGAHEEERNHRPHVVAIDLLRIKRAFVAHCVLQCVALGAWVPRRDDGPKDGDEHHQASPVAAQVEREAPLEKRGQQTQGQTRPFPPEQEVRERPRLQKSCRQVEQGSFRLSFGLWGSRWAPYVVSHCWLLLQRPLCSWGPGYKTTY